LTVHYEHNTQKAIEAGVAKDPTIIWNGKIIIEGLIPAEEITKIFENLLGEIK
jgi:predicted DsbA family dithiol-disulfide isomerase